MAIVSIIRRREWMLSHRRIEIFLDGKNLGHFPKGIKKEIDLPAGEHKLRAKMNWYSSKDLNFTLFRKEKRSFMVSTNKAVFIPVVLFPVIYALTEIFTRNSEMNLFLIHTIGVLLTVYMIIFFRSNYLIIKEEIIN